MLTVEIRGGDQEGLDKRRGKGGGQGGLEETWTRAQCASMRGRCMYVGSGRRWEQMRC